MEFLSTGLDFLTNFDVQLRYMIDTYGYLTYGVLFLIIFCETGLVVTPFLPGDSLLFISGTFAALGLLNVSLLLFLLILAATTGNLLNYQIGRWIGPKVFTAKKLKLIKQSHLKDAKAFLDHHGVIAIVLSRFVPIVRTFAPFVAGVGKMEYKTFSMYNLIGAVLWTTVFIMGGYFFGNIPLIQNNYTLVITGILVISLLPTVYAVVRNELKKNAIKKEL